MGPSRSRAARGGDCTVKLILTASDSSPAGADLRTAVYNHIMRPDDPSQRLAGVNDLLIVMAPTTVVIAVAATVETDGTATMDAIREELRLRLTATAARTERPPGRSGTPGSGAELKACAGVKDYSGLTINGGTANVPVDTGEIPVTAGTSITLTEGTVV